MNKWVGIGRLCNDPELKFTAGNGIAVSTFTLAVDRNFKTNGENQADFINIRCWRKLAELVANNLSKGRLVAVSGRIEIGSYEKDGTKRYTFEVVADEVKFLDRAKADDGFYPLENDSDTPF